MVKDMADQFMEADVRPVTNLLEKQGPGLMPGLIEKAGELGLFGTAIPEEYGGLGRDFITTSIVCEELSNMGNCFFRFVPGPYGYWNVTDTVFWH